MTENKLLEIIAAVLHEDTILQSKFTELYGKACVIFNEYDPRKYPAEKDAPFIYLNIDSSLDDLNLSALEKQAGLVLGIFQKEVIKTPYGTKMKALEDLTDIFIPRITEILRTIPQTYVESIEKDFIFENFPLCMASLTLTIKERTPIGRMIR